MKEEIFSYYFITLYVINITKGNFLLQRFSESFFRPHGEIPSFSCLLSRLLASSQQ